MPIRPVATPNAPAVAGPYVPAVRAGDWVICSGQLGLDPRTGRLVNGGAIAQARRALANLGAVLASAGLSLSDVAKTTVFVTDLGGFAEVNHVFADAFGGHRPTRSTVEVSALPLGADVEIEAWAWSG